MDRIRVQRSGTNDVYIGTQTIGSIATALEVDDDFRYSRISDRVHRGPPYKTGGPLSISREYIRYSPSAPYFGYSKGLPDHSYRGRFQTAPWIPGVAPTEPSLDTWGAIGWNRASPVSPVFNLANSIYELKDVPRMIEHARSALRSRGKDLLRDPGSAYLGGQFGWSPLFGDIWGLMNLHDTLNKKLAQLRRDNGKRIRRRMTLNVESNSNHLSTVATNLPQLGPTISTRLNVNSPGAYTRTSTLTYQRNIWFAGRFRYWIPELAQPGGDERRLVFLLLGLTPTADVLYRSLPWSWLLDWFTNVGPILENMTLNAAFHVLADYAYVMGHTSYDYKTTANGTYRQGTFVGSSGSNLFRCWCTTHHKYEWKRRIPASPYGFGLSDASFNAYQWSILGALGLSRLS